MINPDTSQHNFVTVIDSANLLHPHHPVTVNVGGPYPADHDYCRFLSVFLIDQIMLFGMKCVSKHQYLQIFVYKINKYISNFHPLEVVDRGSETQLQLGEN